MLSAADGEVTAAGLVVQVTGHGPRRAPLFVNDEVFDSGADGRFTVAVTLPPGAGWLVAGVLTGCACVTHKSPVTVDLR